MLGIFKKKTRRASAEIKKFEKRDLAQAVINAAYLVAYADGECEASEKAKIEQVLRNQPTLSAFTSEINAISATIIGQLDTNFKIGRRAALREIEDVKHDTREAEAVLDVAVDIRKNSPTFGQWRSCLLTEENKRQFYVPEGFAHGFSVLSEEAVFAYKCTALYDPADEGGIMYNDPQLNIDWQIPEDRKSTRQNSSHIRRSRMPSSA